VTAVALAANPLATADFDEPFAFGASTNLCSPAIRLLTREHVRKECPRIFAWRCRACGQFEAWANNLVRRIAFRFEFLFLRIFGFWVFGRRRFGRRREEGGVEYSEPIGRFSDGCEAEWTC
jgi:hypothetical protein